MTTTTLREVKIAIPDGRTVEGLETRRVGRVGRFALTRYDASVNGSGKSDWTITHIGSGMSAGAALPLFEPRTIRLLSAIIKAWDALEGVDWSVMDDLPFGGQLPKGDPRVKKLGDAMRLAAQDVAFP